MAASVISIANRSLLSIGARAQVSSLQEASAEANAISVLFAPTFESLGRTAWWNCLRRQGTLTLLKAAQGTPENPNGTTLPLPPQPWLYSYALPSDCLHMRFIVPSFPAQQTGVSPLTTASVASPINLPNQGQIPFAVAYDTDANGSPITVVLTNQSQAQAVYTVNQSNPQIWDSGLQAAMVASLAAYLVPALSLDKGLMTASINTAEKIIAQARTQDANEGTHSQDHQPDWITARAGSGGAGYGYGYWGNQYQFIGMSWPGGA